MMINGRLIENDKLFCIRAHHVSRKYPNIYTLHEREELCSEKTERPVFRW